MERPVLLRDELVLALRAVGVGVDQAGDDRLAGDVDDVAPAGMATSPRAADRGDAVAVDQDHAVVDRCRRRRPPW